MKVTLRQRHRGKLIHLYLDYYHKGDSRKESLNLTLFPKPENGKLEKWQKDQNDKNLNIAETIRLERWKEIQNDQYGFMNPNKLKGSFLEFVQRIGHQHYETKGTFDTWDSALKHLKNFANERNITFGELNAEWLTDFRTYLAKYTHAETKQPLALNTCYTYFNKIKAAIRQAHEEGIIKENFVHQVKGFTQSDPDREYLSLEELQRLEHTPCYNETLKRAFIFSALTGLRWSDIEALTWGQIRRSDELGWIILYRQKKTKSNEYLPISDETRARLGEPGPGDQLVFRNLTYSDTNNRRLQQWVNEAGIPKKITFHCARHTNATLLQAYDVDIYTISKLLGHKNVRTTEIYAKVVDAKKRAAANKIVL
jgi:integrase